MLQHGNSSPIEPESVPVSQSYRGPFGRLFRSLPAYEPDGKTEEQKQKNLEKLAADMVDDRRASWSNNRIPAGYAFFGQVLAHDMSFDLTSVNMRHTDPGRVQNFRTPRLDLDHIYGGGPWMQPTLYERANDNDPAPFLFRIDELSYRKGKKRWKEEDVPHLDRRNARSCVPVMADPRNATHLITSELHLAILKFHNRALRDLNDPGNKRAGSNPQDMSPLERFREAVRLTQWHYQWVIVHDFLERLVGTRTVTDLLAGKVERVFHWKNTPYIPIEFSAGAYRVGHAMLGGSYRLNGDKDRELGLYDLLGVRRRGRGRRVRYVPTNRHQRTMIAWRYLVPVEGQPRPQESAIFQPRFARELAKLPTQLSPDGDETSLVERDLIRSWKLGLPSGQSIAKALGYRVSDSRHEPLLVYLLKEAAREGRRGRQLGPVGGRLVAEVILGLLEGDPTSYLHLDPEWRPQFDHDRRRGFDLCAFLRHARMPMTDDELPWNL